MLAFLLPACSDPPARWQALDLRSVLSGPAVLRTLVLGLADGSRRSIYTEEQEPTLAMPGEPLTQGFTATEPFQSVRVLVAAWGDADSRPRLRLFRDAGSILIDEQIGSVVDRSWIEVRAAAPVAPGSYTVELSAGGAGRVGWWGAKVAVPSAEGLPFDVQGVPIFTNGDVTIPVGATATRLAVLGGVSTYDHGIGWWRDYEARGDSSDRQLVGDDAGSIQVRYASGTIDDVPLRFGYTMWWYTHLASDAWGGPFDQPFGGARDVLYGALRLHPAGTFFWWDLALRPEPIASIRLVDNPGKQGVPIVGGISLLTKNRYPTLKVVSGDLAADKTVPFDRNAIDRQSREAADRLGALLYQSGGGTAPLPAASGPDLVIDGPPAAALLTGIWRANRADLLAKFDGGRFRTSTPGAPLYGGYQGVGSWRDGVGYFSEQVWARDLGRAMIEVARFGDVDRLEPSLLFAGDRQLDVSNGFPAINRDGERVPPHWTTVLGDPLYLDADRKGDGNQENDAAGLILLAYQRVWLQRDRDPGWLSRHLATVRTAGDWFVEQLARPDRWRSANGLLYGEGEAANDGGYDVYSNTLAWNGLVAAAEMAAAAGEMATADRFRSAATTIRAAVNRDLVTNGSYRSVAWNWGYGLEALAPALVAADSGDLTLASLTAAERDTVRATYDGLIRQCLTPTGCLRVTGYGQAFAAQSALLLDDVATAGQLLEVLAVRSHDPRRGPYLIPEGIAVAPDGRSWYRTGDLGNAVQQAEVLKALALLPGIAETADGSLSIVPRLPDAWTSISATNWRVRGGTVSLKVSRSDGRLLLELSLPRPARVRASSATVNGVAVEVIDGWVTVPAGDHRLSVQP